MLCGPLAIFRHRGVCAARVAHPGRPVCAKKASRAVPRCRKIAIIDMASNRLGRQHCAASSVGSSKARVAFVTVGQSPRDDIVPELLAQIGRPVDAAQFGALDGLGADAVMALAPRPGEPSLATRGTGTT